MDRRINYRMVIDTETCPIIKELEEVNPRNMLAYDIGWAIVDKRGNVYRKHSFCVKEIFIKEHDLMQSAYYSEKIPRYWEDIKNGNRYLRDFFTIREILFAEIKEFNITEIYAHNMYFDYTNLNNTIRYLTEGRSRYFFPYGMTICDTLKMSRNVLGTMPTYKRFCIENDFLTKNNQCRYTAEIIYKFLTQDLTFEESHTGLEDVLIEKDILAYCFKQHKKMNRQLFN